MENLFQLISNFKPAGDQPQAIATLLQGLKDGIVMQTLLGVTGSGKTFTMAHVIASSARPTLILAPNKTLAAQLYGEMKAFFPNNAVEYFVSYYDYYQPEAYLPTTDTYIEKDSSINEHIEQMRLSATKSILERRDVIIVASVSAIYGLGDPESYASMVIPLRVGSAIDRTAFLRRLAELQYQRNDIEFRRATFRARGEVFDIFPAEEDVDAVRVECFDDVIEHIYLFDPLTGKINRSIPKTTIYPKTHYATPRATILDAMVHIKEELKVEVEKLRADNKLVEAQRLEQRTMFDLEMMNEIGYCSGIENYSRYLSKRVAGEPPPTLMDYLPDDALLFIDESHVTIPQLNGMYGGDRSRKETLVNYGFRLPSALDNRPLRFDEFLQKAPQMIFVSATPGPYEGEHTGVVAEQVVRPTGLIDPQISVRPVASQIDDLIVECKRVVAAHERVLVTTLTKRMAEELTKYLADQGIAIRYLHSDIETVERVEIIRDLRKGVFDVLVGINLLREGLDLPEVSLVAILDADKEGFLRSGRSLIQTIGRAARNEHGMVIMYADKMTGSMQYAIDETNRRREKQRAFNEAHGIIPHSVQTEIKASMASEVQQEKETRGVLDRTGLKVSSTTKDIVYKIKQLEKQMYTCAKNLEFEEAARLRDEIHELNELIVKQSAR